LEAGLFRIAQETVGNAVRHAAPKAVSLRLTFRPTEVALEVADDGRGFATDTQAPGRFGLVGVSERVQLLGGKIEVRSAPGAGTRIAVTVPLNGGASAA
jgi:two-component system sensor histidine kinase DegS